MWFEVYPYEHNARPNHFKIYIPCRTCIVLCPYEKAAPLLQKDAKCIERMPQVTDRQKQQLQKLGLANKNQELHKQAIMKQAEESKKNDNIAPKTTVVNKR